MYGRSMIKALLIFILVPLAFGTVFGLISSYRAGQKPHEPVYLSLKNFAQRFPAGAVYLSLIHI